MNDSLSKRGQVAASTIMRVDLELSFEAMKNQFDPVTNPTGQFPLSIAENRLKWETLKKKFQQIASDNEIDDWVMGYTSPLGDENFREAIASFYEKFLTTCFIDPASIACSPGASGIVEMTALLLADEGDVVAVPAPCYPVYRQDMHNIPKVNRYDILTYSSIDEIGHGPLLHVGHLNRAKQEIEHAGNRLRLLVITTPDNPTGMIYSQQHLTEIADWCIEHKVHLIVNEIYALSLIDITHPLIQDDYQNAVSFQSFAQLMLKRNSNYLHHWYSFSKDFGISGFRVGLVHSHNEDFIKAYENYNLTHSISNHTQWLLMHLVQDDEFLKNYIPDNQKTLTTSYVAVVSLLKKHGIPYIPSRGGLFVWIDFSKYLAQNSEEAEMKFWMTLYESTGVLLTPGYGFGHLGYGFFRMVYPYVSLDILKVALSKLDAYLSSNSIHHIA